MKWINAEQQVTVTIYDEEHEEHHDKIMTVEEMLDAYTNEGCPTIYSNPERKKGKWISTDDGWDGVYFVCSVCGCPWTLIEGSPEDNGMNYCPNCGADMRG